MKNLCIEKTDESMDMHFLKILIWNMRQMTQTDERYLLKPRIEYVMRNPDSSVLDSGTLYLDSENYSQNTLLETWIDSLNTQYQSVKGLTSSDTESIG